MTASITARIINGKYLILMLDGFIGAEDTNIIDQFNTAAKITRRLKNTDPYSPHKEEIHLTPLFSHQFTDNDFKLNSIVSNQTEQYMPIF